MFSANIHAMDGLDGYENANFFKRSFSTHMKESQSNFAKFVGSKFAKASRGGYILQVGLRNFATYDVNGDKSESPKYPFRLVFQPMV